MTDDTQATPGEIPNDSAVNPAPLPAGRWQVDPAQSRVGFVVKTMWGLASVKGHFHRYSGTLETRDGVSRGTLQIESASLDTNNGRRDDHLRSADFFGADEHPRVTFTVNSIGAEGDGATVDGELHIKDKPIALRMPVTVGGDRSSRLTLNASAEVARDEAGMTWNRVGMISGPARLEVELVLEPAA